MEAGLLRKAYLGLVVMAVGMASLASCGIGSRGGMARGRDVFKTCIPCHGENGAGNLALRAPAIAGLPDWYITTELTKFQTNIRGAHPDDDEGARMRPMARTLYHPGDLQAVAAYVASLPPASVAPLLQGDRGQGQKQYTSICIACHGPDGKGNQALGAPPLVRQADWYLVAQLKKFKTGMRGAHPDDVAGSQMRAMSSTLQDTTAMRDVVAYIKSLPN
jgi:cytochrome c553